MTNGTQALFVRSMINSCWLGSLQDAGDEKRGLQAVLPALGPRTCGIIENLSFLICPLRIMIKGDNTVTSPWHRVGHLNKQPHHSIFNTVPALESTENPEEGTEHSVLRKITEGVVPEL